MNNTSFQVQAQEEIQKSEALLALSEMLSTKEISKAAMGLYLDLLKDFTALQVRNGVVEILKTEIYKTMPAPAKIIEAIEKTSGYSTKAIKELSPCRSMANCYARA